MIDKKLGPYYDILFSIFFGIVIILLLHYMYDSPRSVIFLSNDKEKFANIKFPCTDLSIK